MSFLVSGVLSDAFEVVSSSLTVVVEPVEIFPDEVESSESVNTVCLLDGGSSVLLSSDKIEDCVGWNSGRVAVVMAELSEAVDLTALVDSSELIDSSKAPELDAVACPVMAVTSELFS